MAPYGAFVTVPNNAIVLIVTAGSSNDSFTGAWRHDISEIRANALLGSTAIQGVQLNGSTINPSSGNIVNITNIPKEALASAVQTSLEKADTAL